VTGLDRWNRTQAANARYLPCIRNNARRSIHGMLLSRSTNRFSLGLVSTMHYNDSRTSQGYRSGTGMTDQLDISTTISHLVHPTPSLQVGLASAAEPTVDRYWAFAASRRRHCWDTVCYRQRNLTIPMRWRRKTLLHHK